MLPYQKFNNRSPIELSEVVRFYVFIRFADENSYELRLMLLWSYEFNIQLVQIGGTIDDLV